MNPYTPGFARNPPVFAGRESELGKVKEITDRMAAERGYQGEVLVFGPRGNGKTAFLAEIADRLKSNRKVRTVTIQAFRAEQPRDVHQAILGKPVPTEERVTTKSGEGLGVSSSGFGASRESSKLFGTDQFAKESRVLRRMKSRPTLLLVDEAHRITQPAMKAILSLVTEANLGKASFGIVMAGTPGLTAHLRNMKATFLNRAQYLRMDRLDETATRKALFEPLEQAGRQLNLGRDEQRLLIDATQQYPHFIQCVGHALWENVESLGQTNVDSSSVESTRPRWEERITMMYNDRLEELEDRSLTDYAIAVATEFSSSGLLVIRDIQKTIEKVNHTNDVTLVVDNLKELGFFWSSKKSPSLFEPGIPSLMDHVLQNERIRSLERSARSRDYDLDLER